MGERARLRARDHLTAELHEDGSLVIRGHELGSGVGAAWGSGYAEYEFGWSIEGDQVPALARALGGRVNVLEGLIELFASDARLDFSEWCKQHEIAYEFWSRLGD